MKLISQGAGGGLVAIEDKSRSAIVSGGGNGKGPAPGSPVAAQQRGRKRAASCDAADPATRKSHVAGGGGGGAVGTGPTGMDVESSSPAKQPGGGSNSSSSKNVQGKDVSLLGAAGGGGAGDGGEPSPRAAAAEAASVAPARLPGISGGGAGKREKQRVDSDGDGLLPIQEIRSAGVIAGSAVKARVVAGGGMHAAPPELPLLELEKESTVDTLFELMESGQSVSVLVWDLLMMMPTNMRLYNGLS